MARAGRLAPVDRVGGIAGLVLAELPEGLAHPGAPPAVHARRHGGGDPVGLDQERRQTLAERLGGLAQPRRLAARGPPRSQATCRQRRSMTSSTPMPSARAAKVTAMRWRSTGPGQGGHILDRGRQPAVEQRPDPHRQHQALAGARARPPGDLLRRGPGSASFSGRPARTSRRMSSISCSPIGIRRTSRCMPHQRRRRPAPARAAPPRRWSWR